MIGRHTIMHRVQKYERRGAIRRHRHLGAARLFFAAADPTRLKILVHLARTGKACVTDIAREFGMSVASVSHHLRILQECRCLKTVRMAKMICYQFVPNPFTTLVLDFIKRSKAL